MLGRGHDSRHDRVKQHAQPVQQAPHILVSLVLDAFGDLFDHRGLLAQTGLL